MQKQKYIHLLTLVIFLSSCATLPTNVCKIYDNENMIQFQPDEELTVQLVKLLENNPSFEWSEEQKTYWFTDNSSRIKLCRTNVNARNYCGSSYRNFEKQENDWILLEDQIIHICLLH